MSLYAILVLLGKQIFDLNYYRFLRGIDFGIVKLRKRKELTEAVVFLILIDKTIDNFKANLY